MSPTRSSSGRHKAIGEAADTSPDDGTVAYILEHRPHFEDLRQIAAQLAGLVVLSASGAKAATPDHPLLESAAQLFEGAADAIRRARPPLRAREHHRRRVIPVHEERLKDLFPSRISNTGLRITELALAEGEASRVR